MNQPETPKQKTNGHVISVDFTGVLSHEPYTIEYFKRAGLYIEKPSNGNGQSVIETGEVIQNLPSEVKRRLRTISAKPEEDPSVVDFGVIMTLLEQGLTPQDTRATFANSPRGKNAAERHPKFDDWIQRTITKAVAFVSRNSAAIEPADGSDWRKEFRSRSELDQTPLKFAIERLVPEEGITGIGGLSGHAKTWVMLSMAKQMATGGYLWGKFKTNKYPVLYLIPEVGDRSFFHRMHLLHIPDGDHFLVRTMSEGKTLPLSSAVMQEAARGRVVFLDTLPRFTEGKDEQQARDMAALGETLLGLMQAGAVAVVFAHHSPKASREKDDMDLENVFRGSGDIGAIMSAGHGLRMLDANKTLVQVECVKARDFEPSRPFQLEGRPWINKEGDFHMVKRPGQCGTLAGERNKRTNNALAEEVLALIRKTPGLSGNKICEQLGRNRNRLYAVLSEGNGKLWKKEKEGKSERYYAIG